MTLLRLRNLSVSGPEGPLVGGIDLDLAPGETLALLGPSGAGKSLTAAAIVNQLPKGLHRGGEVALTGPAGMVFQHPRAVLNPIRSIGEQLADVLAKDPRATGMKDRISEHLGAAQFPPERAGAYPFQLSGGQCQRAAIAIALAAGPRLLLADEPTTDLDTLAQREIMVLLRRLCVERGMGLILITHDLPLAARWCERIAVMEAGRIVEEGPAARLLTSPMHETTRRLVAAACPAPVLPPPVAGPRLVEARGLRRSFVRRRLLGQQSRVDAVRGVNLVLHEGESLGLIGPSGSGKTTLARMIARLEPVDAGGIVLSGEQIATLSAARFARSPLRRQVQIAMQDATGALAPHFTLRRILSEPLRRLCGRLSASQQEERIGAALAAVGLEERLLPCRPGSLSGGQRARAGLARALVVRPRLLVLDEATSSLDAALQAEILTLIDGLRRREGIAVLAITHDMGVVERLCERVMVMARGEIVEEGRTEEVLRAPRHPLTRALIEARP